MPIGKYISIITLNVNGLNALTKRHRLVEQIQKTRSIHRLSTRDPTPVLLPGKPHGWRSLVGCRPWGH